MELAKNYYSQPAGVYADDPERYAPNQETKRIADLTGISPKKLAVDSGLRYELNSRVMGAAFVLWLLQRNQLTALDLILNCLEWLDVAFLTLLTPSLVPYLRSKKSIFKKIFITNTRANDAGKLVNSFLAHFLE